MKLGTCLGLSCAYFTSVAGQALEDKLGLSDDLPTSHPGLSPQLWLLGQSDFAARQDNPTELRGSLPSSPLSFHISRLIWYVPDISRQFSNKQNEILPSWSSHSR